MTKMGVNIYKEARKKAEFKREPAAEELGMTVDNIDPGLQDLAPLKKLTP